MVPPFLACGAPIKSSMVLALLIAVAGLDGGAEGGPEPDGPAPKPGFRTDCSPIGIGEAALEGCPEGFEPGEAVSVAPGGPVMLMGGVAVPMGNGGTGGVSVLLGGGAPDALTALEGGPLGGGGRAVSVGAGVSPPFLFTHFLRSLS